MVRLAAEAFDKLRMPPFGPRWELARIGIATRLGALSAGETVAGEERTHDQ